jgi:hypothetical protein
VRVLDAPGPESADENAGKTGARVAVAVEPAKDCFESRSKVPVGLSVVFLTDLYGTCPEESPPY